MNDKLIQGYKDVFGNIGSGLQSFGNWLFQGNPIAQGINSSLDLNGSSAAQQQFNNQMTLNQQSQEFNASEAEKQRQWEEMMSSTEMQRRVKDLEAAGLNPYLAMAGSLGGASAGSGSSASSSSGNADMANNKITAAAGLIAVVLKMILTKGK